MVEQSQLLCNFDICDNTGYFTGHI